MITPFLVFYFIDPVALASLINKFFKLLFKSFTFAINKLTVKGFILIAKLLILILLHTSGQLVSQEAEYFQSPAGHPIKYFPAISPSDSIALSSFPVIPNRYGTYKSKELPYFLDNSTQPYFRPLFEQVASECGQYASIGFNFTYEINYTRNTAANVPENQFPTHYTYNFMNGGFGWHGVSYFHSFEIAKINGHPSITDFGSNNECGPSYWMNGYDSYYNGMSNKIDEVYQIPVGNEEGLMTLKNWLHNHLTGDDVGGIACFYSATPWNLNTLPSNSPEAGKRVITEFKYPASHASTITGYHDSIRYDYNQDGQFTNHLDINEDGKIDMRDWEIGGLKFTDSYQGGTSWADSGFCYMMYKTLADRLGEGGIWNNVAHVVRVKENYEPLISMKVKLDYNCRDKIKIMAGISDSPGMSFPQHTMGFPIYDFQGACQFMQGGWEPEAKTIELGLDITPLLGRIKSNEEALFFLHIIENDPNNQGSGKILEYSIINHMNDDEEYSYPGTEIPISDNDITTLVVNATLEFNSLDISNQILPMALTGEQYEHQMVATGGTPPYQWKLVETYDESLVTAAFPNISGSKLEFHDTIHSATVLPLDFDFPFYGLNYDSIWVHTDGFIMFDDQTYPWPYLYDEHLMIRKTCNISPFLNNNLFIKESIEDGVWYEADENKAIIRWKMSSTMPAGESYEFALSLYPSGRIDFQYNEDIVNNSSFAAGISKGDDISYQYPWAFTYGIINSEEAIVYEAQTHPYELTLSDDGILSGVPEQNYTSVDLIFDVRDKNLLNRRKMLKFNSYYADINEHQPLPVDNLSIWPNPSSRLIHIDFTLKQNTRIVIELIDQYGKLAHSIKKTYAVKGNHQLMIDLESLPNLRSGVYYLLMSGEGHGKIAKKIIIAR